MVLIISSQGQELSSPIERRFGRCPWLIKFDTETKNIEVFANPGMRQSGGAGVAAAQFVIDQNADAVVSGDFGPNAARAFQAGDIKMYLFNGNVSSIQDVVDDFLEGKLTEF
jgi:predicted Fe-Mo cluster-binding NifX family protein